MPSALADLLDTGEVIDAHQFCDCHDLLLEHNAALFDNLIGSENLGLATCPDIVHEGDQADIYQRNTSP